MNLKFSITELSSLTGKSRPTLYKYITNYNEKKYDNLPYSFIKLFDLILDNETSNREIIDYCNKTFLNIDDEEFNNFIDFLRVNKQLIDFKQLKKIVEEYIKDEYKIR